MSGESGLAAPTGLRATTLALLMLAASCSEKKPESYHSVAMETVNNLVAQAMTQNRAAAENPGAPATACAAYRHAAEALERAARIMSDMPAPDAGSAGAAGWTTASQTVTTQRARIDQVIQQTCTP
jgi:hypothetical protein